MFILKQVSTVSKQQMAVSVLQQNWSAFRKMALHYDLLSIQSEKKNKRGLYQYTHPSHRDGEWDSKVDFEGIMSGKIKMELAKTSLIHKDQRTQQVYHTKY